jgi:hypothetical protein
MSIENKDFLGDFDLLIKLGVVGLFDHFELTEVVRYRDGKPDATNVFTIAVALENGIARKTEKLNDTRIRLPSAKGYSFGVFRSVLSTDSLRRALQGYLTTKKWMPGDAPILVGTLQPIAKQFVPPTGSTEVPLNRVLKNNFFNGSHVLELFDVEKQSLQDFFSTPTAVLQLSNAISEIIPLGISATADRLGNIIVQFPVEALRADFRSTGSSFIAEIAWHPKITQRPVTVTAGAVHDHLTISYGQKQLMSGLAHICDDPGHGVLHGSLWDNENGILLAQTGEQAFIKTVALNLAMIAPEPRTMPERIGDLDAKIRIKQSHQPNLSFIGGDPKLSITEPITRRIYEEELATLIGQRKFIQYGAGPRLEASDRQRALNDVRSLIASYGPTGVWLWDPFLGPQDILDTLFYNPTMDAPMRALTLLKEPTGEENEASTKLKRRDAYRTALSKLSGNYYGLNIEFRSAHGPSGWDFHDRFLIFPKSNYDRAKVWSLGTSVNSLGKSHHILQQVENAQLIADAFQSLWDAVEHHENVIWKCP